MKQLFLLCILIASLWVMPAQAVTLLSEGWEGSCDDVANRGWLPSYNGTETRQFPCGDGSTYFGTSTKQPFFLDTGVSLFGTNSLRLNYQGTQYDTPKQGGGNAIKYFSQDATEIWITFYTRMSAGFLTAGGAAYPPYTGLGGAATKGLYQYMISSKCNIGTAPQVPAVSCSADGAIRQENGWVFHYMGGGRQLIMTAQGIKDAVPTYQTQNLNQNIRQFNQPDLAWICYEAHIKLNTGGLSNGLYEQYATNVSAGGTAILTTRYLNRRFLGDTINDMMPSDAAWHVGKVYRQDGLGQMWYDNITYTTTRVGCTGGGGGAGDTTPPSTPTITGIDKTSTSATLTFTGSTDAGGMLNYLILRCTGGGCTNHTQVDAVNHTTGTSAGTYIRTNTGLTAGTTYSYRVRGQDTSGNISSASAAVEVTLDSATGLPTISAFDATASGGTVAWSTSPATAYVKVKFGGGTTSSEFTRTIAQLPGGVLTFQWPQTTTWACVEAGNAVPTYNTASDAYRCDKVSPQAATGAGLLKLNTVNGRYLQAGSNTKAIYLTGRSSGNNCNAALCGLHDWVNEDWTDLIEIQDNSDTFDGTSTDIGTLWTMHPQYDNPLTKVSGVIQPTNMVSYANNAELYHGFQEADQFRCVTVGTFNDAGPAKIAILLRYSETVDTGYEFRIQRNAANNASIREITANSSATLASDATTTATGGDEFCAEAVGSLLTFKKNGTEILSINDSTIRHGNSGIMLGGTNAASSTTVTSTRGGYMGGDIDTTLDAIVTQGQSFVRTWRQEQSAWCDSAVCAANTHSRIPLKQFPWVLTGIRDDTTTGTTIRVGVYDLDTFNQAWFDRVRDFVIKANAKGIIPSIMLFSPGHQSYQTYNGFSHPLSCPTAARCNNEQGINADIDADGHVEESYNGSATNPVYPTQVAYINKMVDTLHDLDGFFFEIGNELYPDGTTWHNDMYDAIRAREAAMGYQAHLVAFSAYGMLPTPVFSDNTYLFNNTKPEIVSPANVGSDNYITNPPATFTAPLKVVLMDSDHLAGAMPTLWPWKVFLRGMYPVLLGVNETAGELSTLLTQMAQTRVYAEKMDLVNMSPENTSATDIFSTSYGLSSGTTTKCSEYLLLIPTDAAGTIDLSKYNCTGATTFDVEYFNITSGVTSSGGTTTGGAVRSFNPTGSDPMAVYLKAQTAPADTTAPVLSGGYPSGIILAAGTTSTPMNVISTEPCEARYDDTAGVAHALKATPFTTTDVTSHTTTVGSLTDGTAHLKYVTCEDPSGNISLEYPISWSVAAVAADTTNTGTINSLGGISTASDTAIRWELTEGTPDANHSHYVLEIAEGGQGDIFTPPAILTIVLDDSLAYTQQGLVAGHSYISRAKDVDTSGNVSEWLTSSAVHVELPETMTGLTAANLYTNSAIVTVDEAAQNGVNGSYELCVGAACNSGWTSAGIPAGLSVTFSSLLPNTTYGVRGKWVNTTLGGISAEWSSTLYFTTTVSGGTGGPRTSPSYGIERTPLANPRTPLQRSRIAR